MEQSPPESAFVGTDVAKDRLDVHLRPSGEAFAVGRDADGLAALVERVARLAPRLVVLEATGGFEAAVAAALAAAGLPLAVVNPRQIRTSPGPPGGWPRPTASTPRPSRASPRPPGRSRGRSRTARPRRSASSSPAAANSSK